ncbi:hypothetical protein CHUAL_012319 [Chamberlinius hualienensis]
MALKSIRNVFRSNDDVNKRDEVELTTDCNCNGNSSVSNSTSDTMGHCSSNYVYNEGLRLPAKNCYRLVILGSSKVGKTAIVSRFLNNKYDDKYTPTIEDFHRKLYRIRGQVYQLDILDTSGNHPFPAMRRLSLLTGDLFILVYCIDNRESFEEVCRLREQILETKVYAVDNNGQRKSKRIPVVIVGNKCDRETDRVVTSEEVKTYVSGLTCCAFLESSAKKDIHIEDVFCKLFVLGNLPLEMSPSLHKKVQPGYAGFCPVSRKKGLPLRRRLSDAYGSIAPNARRPSLRTDLLILQAKTSSDSLSRNSSKIMCAIQ